MQGTKQARTPKAAARRVATMGMLLALMLMLTFTPLGFLTIGPIAATLVHLPVLVGLMAEGLGAGLGLGLAFGAASMIRAYTTPTITSFLFMNPIVAILPRVLVPLAAWGVYRAFSKKRRAFALGAGAFAGTAVNTVGVLTLIGLLYAERYAEAVGLAPGMVTKALGLVALTNGLPEAILAAVLVPAVTLALERAVKSRA
jgi:uncharacterized membrane protein